MRRRHLLAGLGGSLLLGACTAKRRPDPGRAAGMSPDVVPVPEGSFIQGSDRAERAFAYALDEAAYGHSITREQRWYEGELPRRRRSLPGFAIMTTPVTMEMYARFLADTGHPAPTMDRDTWRRLGLAHPYETVLRFVWRDRRPPPGRRRHPVVLVSHADARAYALWLSQVTGRRWRLPEEAYWEKAARGTAGRYFPWGNFYDPERLNSADRGPYDTMPVGSFPTGASPFGMLDAAGEVYEWTDTPAGRDRYIVKGGSWDDRGCGVCRPAARHGRPRTLRHVLIGFRLITPMEETR